MTEYFGPVAILSLNCYKKCILLEKQENEFLKRNNELLQQRSEGKKL